MRKSFLSIIFLFSLVSCGSSVDDKKAQEYADSLIKEQTSRNVNQNNNSSEHIKAQSAQDYAESLIDNEIGIYNASITDIGMLVIAVDAYPGANFDYFAKSYLDDALEAGVKIKGCLIVDVKNCQFMKGAVTGERIGKAYNR